MVVRREDRLSDDRGRVRAVMSASEEDMWMGQEAWKSFQERLDLTFGWTGIEQRVPR